MITLTGTITFPKESNIPPIIFDRRNTANIDYKILDRSDVELPNWGIISNDGRLTIIDGSGEIKTLAKDKQLKGSILIEFYLNNTTVKNCTVKVGEFYAQHWKYDNDNRTVDIDFSDGLVEWQKIQITPLKVDLNSNSTEIQYNTAYNILLGIATNSGISFELDDDTIYHLQSINVAFPSYEGSLWSVLDDFAVAFQLRIYKNYLGQIVCKYNGEH